MYRLLLILIAIVVPTVATAQTKVKVGTVRATVIGSAGVDLETRFVALVDRAGAASGRVAVGA
jgi:hypothetical protein